MAFKNVAGAATLLPFNEVSLSNTANELNNLNTKAACTFKLLLPKVLWGINSNNSPEILKVQSNETMLAGYF